MLTCSAAKRQQSMMFSVIANSEDVYHWQELAWHVRGGFNRALLQCLASSLTGMARSAEANERYRRVIVFKAKLVQSVGAKGKAYADIRRVVSD